MTDDVPVPSNVQGNWPTSLVEHWRERYAAGVRAASTYVYSPPPVAYHDELMAVARQMLDRGDRPELVVILAQMACEIFAAQVIDVVVSRRGLDFLRDWIDTRLPNSNLANEPVRRLYESLSDDTIGQWAQWGDYKRHSERRNRVVHEGERIDAGQANDSFQVCEALLKHLAAVMR